MFQGFSQNAIDFLWGISLNNERGWFMAHKQDFTDYVCWNRTPPASPLCCWMST